MMITGDNRANCAKCKKNPAITLMENNLWVCGQCLHEYIQKIKETQREAFLQS